MESEDIDFHVVEGKYGEEEVVAIAYLVMHKGYTLEAAINIRGTINICNIRSLKDLAINYVEEGIFGAISDTLKLYLDYEYLANDLLAQGYREFSFNGKNYVVRVI